MAAAAVRYSQSSLSFGGPSAIIRGPSIKRSPVSGILGCEVAQPARNSRTASDAAGAKSFNAEAHTGEGANGKNTEALCVFASLWLCVNWFIREKFPSDAPRSGFPGETTSRGRNLKSALLPIRSVFQPLFLDLRRV